MEDRACFDIDQIIHDGRREPLQCGGRNDMVHILKKTETIQD